MVQPSQKKRRPVSERQGADAANAGGTDLQTLKRQLVREEIVRSAATLFADRGVKGVSLEEVARGLGYTKSSVYYYFRNKEDLLWAVFCYISQHFVEEAERIAQSVPEPLARLQELMRMHVRFLADHKEWTTVFYRDVSSLSLERQKEVRAIIVRYDAVFRHAVQDGIAAEQMNALPPEIVVNAILGACNWMVNWISARHTEKIDDVVETYVQLFTHGLALGTKQTVDVFR